MHIEIKMIVQIYVQLEISTNGGSSWIPQCGKYTKTGSSNQATGEPLYDGFQSNWVKEEINLSDYLGQNIMARFTIIADGGVREDGFYFDDFEINVVYGPQGLEEFTENGLYISQNIPNPSVQFTLVLPTMPDQSINSVAYTHTDIDNPVVNSNELSVPQSTTSVVPLKDNAEFILPATLIWSVS